MLNFSVVLTRKNNHTGIFHPIAKLSLKSSTICFLSVVRYQMLILGYLNLNSQNVILRVILMYRLHYRKYKMFLISLAVHIFKICNQCKYFLSYKLLYVLYLLVIIVFVCSVKFCLNKNVEERQLFNQFS